MSSAVLMDGKIERFDWEASRIDAEIENLRERGKSPFLLFSTESESVFAKKVEDEKGRTRFDCY